jgi:hypothetical protein
MLDPELELSASGQSGILSSVEDRRKIAVAIAINFEQRNAKFNRYLT